MPFGLTNAPATQQRFIEAVLNGVLWQCCFAYIDDILIFSNSFEDHLLHIKNILERACEELCELINFIPSFLCEKEGLSFLALPQVGSYQEHLGMNFLSQDTMNVFASLKNVFDM